MGSLLKVFMKLVISFSCILLSSSIHALSCDTFENGTKTMCNDYADSGNASKLKKLCSAGDFRTTKNKFNNGPCSESNLAAKCVVKSRNVSTFYYKGSDLSAEEMQKGCKFFKDGVFTNISAKSNPGDTQKMNNLMNNLNKNPKMKKYMDCVKSARGPQAMGKCRSLLM
ncbi:MAG: hypothetical protein BM556_05830 [Bacteriovorax sp. MedPE-SWde]|nr:MAG: hypothetical protein BM556_05830 [Bacteriovorax sp. MedPE-SWde]